MRRGGRPAGLGPAGVRQQLRAGRAPGVLGGPGCGRAGDAHAAAALASTRSEADTCSQRRGCQCRREALLVPGTPADRPARRTTVGHSRNAELTPGLQRCRCEPPLRLPTCNPTPPPWTPARPVSSAAPRPSRRYATRPSAYLQLIQPGSMRPRGTPGCSRPWRLSEPGSLAGWPGCEPGLGRGRPHLSPRRVRYSSSATSISSQREQRAGICRRAAEAAVIVE